MTPHKAAGDQIGKKIKVGPTEAPAGSTGRASRAEVPLLQDEAATPGCQEEMAADQEAERLAEDLGVTADFQEEEGQLSRTGTFLLQSKQTSN